MNTFANAVNNQEARTENGMKARAGSASANTDLFFNIGASRGKDIIPQFVAAWVENEDYASRIAQWARDVREGAGERQLFKDILAYMEQDDPDTAIKLITKIPEIGRWDDMLIEYQDKNVEGFAFEFYRQAIIDGNGLAAKWAPRKGFMARKLREAWGMTPKQYRKTIVSLTNVVETTMCNKQWESIQFGKVPSLAAARYKNAFYRNAAEAFSDYVNRVVEGLDKVNAQAVYPYDVLKTVLSSKGITVTEKTFIVEQWNSLPDFMGDASVLPMVDVSGSMLCSVGGSNSSSLNCLLVAMSLGLYCADKNTGAFKDLILTFSNNPSLLNLKGDILQKVNQLSRSDWAMNTNLHAAFDKVLNTAVQNNVPIEEMPKYLVIFSDMQFDSCVYFDDSAIEMVNRKYSAAGYEVPKIVFWNLNATSNIPVEFNKKGVALVSGFSPSVMKSILQGDIDNFTPEAIMLETIMKPRYDL
jgi:hypothetical protein